MDCGCNNKRSVKAAPSQTAPCTAENLGGRQALPRCVEDDRKMDQHHRCEQRRSAALPNIEMDIHDVIFPRRYALVLSFFSEAIAAVGLSDWGQNSVQVW